MKDLTGNNWLISSSADPVRIDTVTTPIDIAVADLGPVGTYKAKIGGTSQAAIQFIVANADAAPKVSIWGSNDATNWDVYELPGAVTELALPLDGSASLSRDSFPHEYIAVKVDKNGGTSGTIKCSINLKNQTV